MFMAGFSHEIRHWNVEFARYRSDLYERVVVFEAERHENLPNIGKKVDISV